ncbi:hypothetical protein [Massilia sp. Root418]|uniref:hypothetical protein n=1 Tax=Massilia sp. Root418 TaxID=1736532 RepID=UPI0012F6E143|nr:hypothetical protein [Massilia sp. Root418]
MSKRHLKSKAFARRRRSVRHASRKRLPTPSKAPALTKQEEAQQARFKQQQEDEERAKRVTLERTVIYRKRQERAKSGMPLPMLRELAKLIVRDYKEIARQAVLVKIEGLSARASEIAIARIDISELQNPSDVHEVLAANIEYLAEDARHIVGKAPHWQRRGRQKAGLFLQQRLEQGRGRYRRRPGAGRRGPAAGNSTTPKAAAEGEATG